MLGYVHLLLEARPGAGGAVPASAAFRGAGAGSPGAAAAAAAGADYRRGSRRRYRDLRAPGPGGLRRLPDPGLRPAAAGGLYLAGRGEPCPGGAAAGGSASGGAAAGCGCQIRGNA